MESNIKALAQTQSTLIENALSGTEVDKNSLFLIGSNLNRVLLPLSSTTVPLITATLSPFLSAFEVELMNASNAFLAFSSSFFIFNSS